jgi:hypothetical protein
MEKRGELFKGFLGFQERIVNLSKYKVNHEKGIRV